MGSCSNFHLITVTDLLLYECNRDGKDYFSPHFSNLNIKINLAASQRDKLIGLQFADKPSKKLSIRCSVHVWNWSEKQGQQRVALSFSSPLSLSLGSSRDEWALHRTLLCSHTEISSGFLPASVRRGDFPRAVRTCWSNLCCISNEHPCRWECPVADKWYASAFPAKLQQLCQQSCVSHWTSKALLAVMSSPIFRNKTELSMDYMKHQK